MTFNATGRLSVRSSARYTTPIPPAPSFPRILYRESISPRRPRPSGNNAATLFTLGPTRAAAR
jgi:hypothetical protein